MKLGFVGTGAITESVVTGLVRSGNDLEAITVSPRNAEVAARLAALHHRVRVAHDNQSVVDSSDIVFLAVRPQVASDVVAGLVFHPGQQVVSFVAGLQLEELAEWTRGTPRLCRAIPVPLVADLRGVTAIFPGDSVVTELFSLLGGVVEAHDAAEFELFGAACCLMGTYFGLLDVIARWMKAKGGGVFLGVYMAVLLRSFGRRGHRPERFSDRGDSRRLLAAASSPPRTNANTRCPRCRAT